MTQESYGWEECYRAIMGHPPRQLSLDALVYFPSDSVQRKAINLGCGDVIESALLLERGDLIFNVVKCLADQRFC